MSNEKWKQWKVGNRYYFGRRLWCWWLGHVLGSMWLGFIIWFAGSWLTSSVLWTRTMAGIVLFFACRDTLYFILAREVHEDDG